jgi:hypothetical protein
MTGSEWPKPGQQDTADAFSTALEGAGPMIRAAHSRGASWEVVRRPVRHGLSHHCGLTLCVVHIRQRKASSLWAGLFLLNAPLGPLDPTLAKALGCGPLSLLVRRRAGGRRTIDNALALAADPPSKHCRHCPIAFPVAHARWRIARRRA